MVRKILVIGPESTGKSTLCKELASHFKTEWCAEFAREYLLKHGKEYSYDDLLTIAKGQVTLEDEYINKASAKGNNLLFIDTDMYVMKVWCEYAFGQCHAYIINQLAERKYDLYLLCNIDLPWTSDELREYPDEAPRKELYCLYKDLLINQQVPFVEINGLAGERTQHAIDAVNSFLD